MNDDGLSFTLAPTTLMPITVPSFRPSLMSLDLNESEIKLAFILRCELTYKTLFYFFIPTEVPNYNAKPFRCIIAVYSWCFYCASMGIVRGTCNTSKLQCCK